MKQILIVVHINTFFTELFHVGKRLQEAGRYEPVFTFYRYPTRDVDIARSAAEKLRTIDPPVPARKLGIPHVAVVTPVVELEVQRRRIRSYLAKLDLALVVLGGDMVGYDTPVWVQECHRRGIPVVLVPSTMADGLEQAEVYYRDPSHQIRGVNRIAARLYPRWVFEHRGKRLLREPGGRVMAMEWMGLAPPLPWIFNSSYADAIAIESEAMLAYYNRCGISGDQLVVTGSLSDDDLAATRRDAHALREDLYRRLDMPPERPMLLSPLPPDTLYMTGGRPECDFKTYPELVEFWVGQLARVKTHNIVISLHPSVKYEDMQHIEREGVKIARQRTATLVPLCDLYVACVSSTIRWAIACGIPVLNYDVYRYRYRDYIGVDGVINIEDQKDYVDWLTRMTTDPAVLEDLRTKQQKNASRWGALDGKAGERTLALFDRVIARGIETSRR